MDFTNPQPPAGWYPDPSGYARMRWWDGYRWTDHTLPGPPAAVSSGALEAGNWQRLESALFPWARLAPVVVMAVVAVDTVVLWAEHGLWDRLGGWWRQLVRHAGQPGYHAPPVPLPHAPAASQLLNLLSLVNLAALVMFLVWQYRAARTARALGYPARHGPGWGVGAWFVPIANLWIPFQSLADCLPRDHPDREGLAWLPVAYFAFVPVSVLLVLLGAIFGVSAAVLLLPTGATVVFAGYVAWRGHGFVQAVHADHAGRARRMW